MASPTVRRPVGARRHRSWPAVLVAALLLSVVGAGASPATAATGAPPDAVEVVPVAQSPGGATHPLRLRVLGRAPDASPLLAGTGASGYTPAQVRSYLGLTGTGVGQTIAIVTAFDAPNAARDLEVFNTTFGLPAPPSFRKVNQTGGTKYPPVDAAWALEAALDVQWAHAVAPHASILLVEPTSNTVLNLMTAVTWAAAQPGVSVVSGSFGVAEYIGQKDHDARCRLAAAVCVFASGDDGNPAKYPATGPWGLAVGGTSLSLDASGKHVGETAWSGSGGGVSAHTPRPAFQPAAFPRRAAPDVSYGADPAKGFAVYSSTPYRKQSGWFQMGGTSAGAPQWAGILAAANQLRRTVGKPVLAAAPTTGAPPLHTTLYDAIFSAAALTDITTGSNGTCGALCNAGAGYDAVTGLGSPRQGLDVALRDAP